MQAPTRDEVLDLILKVPNGYANTLRFKHREFMDELSKGEGRTIGEKLYRWLNPDINPSCKLCGNRTNFKQLRHGYFDFCSMSCRAKYFESFKNGASKDAVAKRAKWRSSLSKEDKARITQNSIFKDKEKREAITKRRVVKRIGKEAYDKLYSEEWLSEQYRSKTASTLAFELGVTTDTVSNAIRRLNLKSPRIGKTSHQEKLIREFIVKELNIPSEDVQLNVKDVIPPKELDIYIPSKGVAIEFCGAYWHSDSNKYVDKPKDYHQQKMLECQAKGIKLLTVWDLDWNRIPDIVKSRIRNALNKNNRRIYARKCVVRTIGKSESRDFLERNHSQGDADSSVQLGLYHKDELVSVMAFGEPRHDSRYQWEIVRSATLAGLSIPGGWSKLINYFKLMTSTESIVSYCDNCWGSGECHAKSGFLPIEVTPPSCFYFKISDIKKGIKRHWTEFIGQVPEIKNSDCDLTEKQIMKKMGYYRLWDCGETVWAYSKGALAGSWGDVWAK